jgi:hypothetical protein
MATGPKGQKHPADVIGNAVRVMEIATGQPRHYRAQSIMDVADDGRGVWRIIQRRAR